MLAVAGAGPMNPEPSIIGTCHQCPGVAEGTVQALLCAKLALECGSQVLAPGGGIRLPVGLGKATDLRRRGRPGHLLKEEAFEFKERRFRARREYLVPVLGILVWAIEVRVRPGEFLGADPDEPSDPKFRTLGIRDVGHDEGVGGNPAYRARPSTRVEGGIVRTKIGAPPERVRCWHMEALAKPIVERDSRHALRFGNLRRPETAVCNDVDGYLATRGAPQLLHFGVVRLIVEKSINVLQYGQRTLLARARALSCRRTSSSRTFAA